MEMTQEEKELFIKGLYIQPTHSEWEKAERLFCAALLPSGSDVTQAVLQRYIRLRDLVKSAMP